MRCYIAFLFICAMIWLSTFVHGCKSKGKTSVVDKSKATTIASIPQNDGTSPSILDSISEDEKDEDDETEDDIDEEDFELICDGHVPLERVKGTPNAIIMGSKKGGTRALIEFVKLHHKIKAAGPEIHYFDRHYDKGIEWYISKMKAIVPNSGEISIEKTPGYFHTPEAPKRVYEMDPNVKLLLILRDPVKRLISDYNQFRSRHLSQGKNYPTLEELVFDRDNEINIEYPVLQRSIYHLHMSRWLMHFPLSQIHIVHGENFISSPWTELNKGIRFERPMRRQSTRHISLRYIFSNSKYLYSF